MSKVTEDSKRNIDALLAEMPAPISDKATLEDLLAESEEFRARGLVFHAIAPSIKELLVIMKLLARLETAEGDEGLAIQVSVARRLFWREDADTWRPASEDEIARCFPAQGLMVRITRAMNQNGLTLEGNG
jgi:hypothetical protein